MSGVICGRVFDKLWEVPYWLRSVRYRFPNEEVLLFSNGDTSSFTQLDCKVIEVIKQDKIENTHVPHNDRYRFQLGAMSLFATVAEYTEMKGYDYIVSMVADEWFVTNTVFDRIKELEQYELIMNSWNGKPWGSYVQRGNVSHFKNKEYMYSRFGFNCEDAVGSALHDKNIKFMQRKDKFGYDGCMGTVHFDTIEDPDAKDRYLSALGKTY